MRRLGNAGHAMSCVDQQEPFAKVECIFPNNGILAKEKEKYYHHLPPTFIESLTLSN